MSYKYGTYKLSGSSFTTELPGLDDESRGSTLNSVIGTSTSISIQSLLLGLKPGAPIGVGDSVRSRKPDMVSGPTLGQATVASVHRMKRKINTCVCSNITPREK